VDFDINRTGVTPKDAATLVLLRHTSEMEVFCVERNRSLKFMGGAIVFPGGKVDDAHDRNPAWENLCTAANPRGLGFAADPSALRALAVAACRESLEEAAILPVARGMLSGAELVALREALATDEHALRTSLDARKLVLDLAALEPFARWITPAAESRRFDARFFLAVAPPGQPGAHDDSETMSSFWAAPSRVLARFDAREVQLAPPTHRTLEILAAAGSIEGAIAAARSASLEPICPKLVPYDGTLALVLPGDREHDVREARVVGRSRYVLRDDRWLPESMQ